MRGLVAYLLSGFLCATAFAHDGEHSADDSDSHASIRVEGDKRIIEANGLPDHKPGQFPNRGNPNSISAQQYRFEMPLEPRATMRLSPCVATCSVWRSTVWCSTLARPRSGSRAIKSGADRGLVRGWNQGWIAAESGTMTAWAA